MIAQTRQISCSIPGTFAAEGIRPVSGYATRQEVVSTAVSRIALFGKRLFTRVTARTDRRLELDDYCAKLDDVRRSMDDVSRPWLTNGVNPP